MSFIDEMKARVAQNYATEGEAYRKKENEIYALSQQYGSIAKARERYDERERDRKSDIELNETARRIQEHHAQYNTKRAESQRKAARFISVGPEGNKHAIPVDYVTGKEV